MVLNACCCHCLSVLMAAAVVLNTVDLFVQSSLNLLHLVMITIYLFTKTRYLGATYMTFYPKFSQSIYWRGMLNRVDFLVQSSLNLLHLVMITIYLFTKTRYLGATYMTFYPKFSQSIYWRGMLNRVDFLVQSSLNLLHLVMITI